MRHFFEPLARTQNWSGARIRKRVGELTVNVQTLPDLRRYFLRVDDACVPIVGDDVLRIAFGLLAQSEGLVSAGLTATELAAKLELDDASGLRSWIDRLLELDLVRRTGRTSATRYFVSPALLRPAGVTSRTTLERVEPHRLRALILEDLERYPNSSIAEVNTRIGTEIHRMYLRRTLNLLIEEGAVIFSGDRRWRRYCLKTGSSEGQRA